MSDWSPYGLEKYRVGGSRRGRWKLLALLAIPVILWLSFALSDAETDIDLGQGSEGIDVGAPPEDEMKPVTVAIAPGRAVLMDQAVGSDGPAGEPRSAFTTESPYPLRFWVLQWGPLVGMLWLVVKLWKRPAKNEVNFGIYKGAMPLEMISATHRDVVYSRRPVEAPLFGRGRRDFVPWEDAAAGVEAPEGHDPPAAGTE